MRSDVALRTHVTTLPGTKRSWGENTDEWIQNEAGLIWSHQSSRDRVGAYVIWNKAAHFTRDPEETTPPAGVQGKGVAGGARRCVLRPPLPTRRTSAGTVDSLENGAWLLINGAVSPRSRHVGLGEMGEGGRRNGTDLRPGVVCGLSSRNLLTASEEQGANSRQGFPVKSRLSRAPSVFTIPSSKQLHRGLSSLCGGVSPTALGNSTAPGLAMVQCRPV